MSQLHKAPQTSLPFVPTGGIGHEATRRAVLKVVESGATHEEPFFIIDLGSVYRKHKQWVRALGRVAPFYAVKCCNEPKILEALASLGTGFDCASKAEMEQVLKMGVEPSRIIFAHPAKSISHIKYARDVGVDLMTFDNETELEKIKEHYPAARMVLRILADDPHAACRLGVKFGAAPKDTLSILQSAKAMGVDVVGVSFHVGSGCTNAEAYHDAVASARRVFNEAATVGYNMTLLDIGGGFPGHDSARISFKDITTVLNDAFDRYFPEDCGVKLMAEPGRYYVASSGTLALNVIAKRILKHEAADGGAGQTIMYYVNDGVYGALNCIMYDHQTPVPLLLRDAPKDAPLLHSSVWGPTCDGLDVIAKAIEMPEMHVGDWIYFEDAGAYTLAAGSCFNGFQRPSHIYTFSASEHFDASELPEAYPVTPRIQTMVNV